MLSSAATGTRQAPPDGICGPTLSSLVAALKHPQASIPTLPPGSQWRRCPSGMVESCPSRCPVLCLPTQRLLCMHFGPAFLEAVSLPTGSVTRSPIYKTPPSLISLDTPSPPTQAASSGAQELNLPGTHSEPSSELCPFPARAPEGGWCQDAPLSHPCSTGAGLPCTQRGSLVGSGF